MTRLGYQIPVNGHNPARIALLGDIGLAVTAN
jgi:hypothetical protein